MNPNSIPDVSSELHKIYGLYFEDNADPQLAIELIDSFLKDYPNHHEALIFKARMLIAIGNISEALEVIHAAEKYDKWRLFGLFDKAEIFLKKKQPIESIDVFILAIEKYADELKNGIDNYLITLNDSNDNASFKKKVFEALSRYWENPEDGDGIIQNLKHFFEENFNKLKP